MSSPIPAQLSPIPASVFHAGSTCPYCQENVVAGQLIVTCPQCSSVHHETCWLHKRGCSSYHCDAAVRGNAGALRPDIVIGSEELKNVYVPPAPVKRASQDVAAQYLPKKPERLSKLALISAVVAGLALIGILGAVLGSMPLLGLGLGLSILALVAGLIAMVRIYNTENRIYGFAVASAGVVMPCALIVVYFIFVGMMTSKGFSQSHIDLKIAENRPTEESLARMPAPTMNAMRANVVVKAGGGFLGEMRYGSGVVIKLEKNKAYIITNKHVIGDSKKDISVLFYNGENSTASVEWMAPGGVDIALIGCSVLTMDKYQPIKILETLVSPGEKVFAVGNPMGLAWSYTEGTISGLRNSKAGGADTELYQTQTPINSGNSGGGLYTNEGALLGINTLTQDKSTAEGLSFAITSASILKLLSPQERGKFTGNGTINGSNLEIKEPAEKF